MPSRQLKSGLITSLRFNRVSWQAQALFIRLIDLVDDYARFDAHPLIVSRAAFPYGDPNGRTIPEQKIEAWLSELESSHVNGDDLALLTRYQVNGVRYLVLHRWTERVRAEKSRCPDPPFNQLLSFASKNVEDSYRRWQLSANVGSCQQMLSPAAEPNRTEPEPNPGTEIIKGAIPSVAESKAQWTALQAKFKRLEALGEQRTEVQDQERKKLRRLLRLLEKKQGRGDWSLVKDEPQT